MPREGRRGFRPRAASQAKGRATRRSRLREASRIVDAKGTYRGGGALFRFGERAHPGGVGLVLGAALARRLAIGGAIPFVGGLAVRRGAGLIVAGVEGLLLGHLGLGDIRIATEAHAISSSRCGFSGGVRNGARR